MLADRSRLLICVIVGLIGWSGAESEAGAGCLDSDGDGVCDAFDDCPNTIPDVHIDDAGCPPRAPGDFDSDGDVDTEDWKVEGGCLSGPGAPVISGSICDDADMDFDGDVDLLDVDAFLGCFSGTDVLADTNCIAHRVEVVGDCLRIVGTGADNLLALRVHLGSPNILEVDVHADGTADFRIDRGAFTCIQVFARGSEDYVAIDESNGVFTTEETTTIDGGRGDDVLIGGSGRETLVGGEGPDFIEGKQGADVVLLGPGDDGFRWNPGDGSDRVEGEGGWDTLVFAGSGVDEVFDLSANGSRLRLIRSVGSVIMDIGGVENVELQALAGVDAITIGDLSATEVERLTVDLAFEPGGGADGWVDSVILNGTGGADVFVLGGGGDGATVEGLGIALQVTTAGIDDRLIINALGGNDVVNAVAMTPTVMILTVNGGAGDDDLRGGGGFDHLNGEADNDTIRGGDNNDVLFGGLGNDRLIWNPGDDTDVMEGGDGADTVEVNGGNGDESFTVTANGARVRFDRINPAPFALDIGTSENLLLNANGGNDTLACTGDLAALIRITADGGGGNDTLLGSNGIDLLLGGDGNDFVDGQQGNDTAFLGAGDDVFQWDPGDGSDTVEGQDGLDTMLFNGSNGDEIFDALANGGRLRFLRNLGTIVMDCNDVERVDVRALGGTDAATINDLTGTDVTEFNVQLAGTVGGTIGDGLADHVTVLGTEGSDDVTIPITAVGVAVTGLAAVVTVTTAEAANDRLTIKSLGGPDTVQAGGLGGGIIGLTINGGTGNDLLVGSGGIDTLNGEEDDDTIRGGDNNDILLGGSGNDRLIWNPGDDTDVMEGGDGVDTVEVNGGNGAEQFAVTANGARVRFDRINPAPFSLDIGTCEDLVLNANGGDDTLACTGDLAALIRITADGGTGNDTLLGSNGIDLLLGGDGNDFVDGQQGNDTAFLGAGDDVFQWDPGDGSDTLEGQDGSDTILFNGSNGSEIFDVSANGGRLRFTRNLGSIVMDCDGVEQLDLNALGSADTVTVNDLAATDVTEVNLNLAGTIGGATGDAQADTIIVNGTNGDDIIDVVGAGTSASVIGLPARVNITNSEGANDSLVVNALGGVDAVTATTLPAGVIKLTVDGGTHNDSLLGSQGDDVLLGGDGEDFIFGDNGADLAFMGADADTFQWNPGDGNDTLEGQDGFDTMLFVGSNSDENVDVSPNGGRVWFLRNVANVTMDLNDVERIDFRALGGVDNVVVGNLSGTDMTEIGLDLRGPVGGGDGAADAITVNGTDGADVFGAEGDAAGVSVFGLQATVSILFSEPANDLLTLNALGEDDVVDATSLEAGAIRLIMNGGLGEDLFLGSEGDDLINGGDGNDTALMGAGNDTFTWNPGDDNDTLEGQAGNDAMLFNGANVNERINIVANGGRVLFTRDIANVTMDLNDVETIDFGARGGADTITVNNLSGTDVTDVDLRLESAAGSGVGDAQPDNVIVNGTGGDDVVLVVGDAGGVLVAGLAAQVAIFTAEAANDRLTINTLAGEDTVEASGLTATGIGLTADGGTQDDILIGGDGADILLGGDGDDVLIGGPGIDILDGGSGSNTIIQ